MKFNITNTFVSLFSVESKSFEKPTDDNPMVAELNIKPSISKNKDMKPQECAAKLAISLNTELFHLKMEHCFLLEFEKKITKTQLGNDGVRENLINYLYPYSRAIIISMMANFGYGAVNLPTISIQ